MRSPRECALLSMLLLSGCQKQMVVQESGTRNQETTTKLEAFQVQTGIIFIKAYTEIGKVPNGDERLGGAEVTAMVFTDVATGQTLSGVVISVTEVTFPANIRDELSKKTDRSFIDYDEIDSLLNGIDYVSKATSDITKLEHFEAIYGTKGKFRVTSFNRSGGDLGATVKTASSGGGYNIGIDGLGELRTLIVKAKQELDSVK
jgi:hypothetical protein